MTRAWSVCDTCWPDSSSSLNISRKSNDTSLAVSGCALADTLKISVKETGPKIGMITKRGGTITARLDNIGCPSTGEALGIVEQAVLGRCKIGAMISAVSHNGEQENFFMAKSKQSRIRNQRSDPCPPVSVLTSAPGLKDRWI
ncbi:hypothetical protein PGTUg99_007775 [Puccinia graminis f. sp. tritici]|uniref:Uncharacterized protein n=1 Tax=Puccinia graminis f. sp. tritici TaxID=56615 RepID=A0A5B0RFF8_PUCGR|nr:hypothetical protein PGTUg99_007775 [Puccinia graminis f. sp. tritici]